MFEIHQQMKDARIPIVTLSGRNASYHPNRSDHIDDVVTMMIATAENTTQPMCDESRLVS